MPVSVWEAFPGRGVTVGENPAYESNWIVTGTSDQSVAVAMVAAATSTTYGSLFRSSIDAKETSPEAWEVAVKYSARKPPEPGDWSFRFDFTGGQEKVFQAWLHQGSYAPPGKTPPDHKGAIGVRDDGDVEGCEIVVPKAKFSETWQFPIAAVTDAYKTAVYDLVGAINDNTFRGCSAGRVLFLGASGQRSARNPDVFEITFEFAVGKHRESFTIGDIEVASKDAWSYLWVEYETKVDDSAHRKVRRPVAVHVERVYASGNFSALGI